MVKFSLPLLLLLVTNVEGFSFNDISGRGSFLSQGLRGNIGNVYYRSINPATTLCAVKKKKKRGGGSSSSGGGFGAAKKTAESSSNSSPPPSSSKAEQKETKRILNIYGGDIQKGTMQRINQARADLRAQAPLLEEALRLTEEQTRWEKYYEGLSILQQSNVPTEAFEKAQKREAQLKKLQDVSVK